MSSIDTTNLPKHVAIIMDGNGRWAESRGLTRLEGHQAGTSKTDEIIMCAHDLGIAYLTLYAFSKENWNRPAAEVLALMQLLKNFLFEKEAKMIKNGIRLNVIGNWAMLPDDVKAVIEQVKQSTSQGQRMLLTLALSYGSRDEIIRVVNKVVSQNTGQEISEEDFSKCLDTYGMPDPDLIIRTSGEYRLSNFLLWQAAYSELVFEECNWPEYTAQKLEQAIAEYQTRERRYGLTSQQIQKGEL